MSIGRGVLGLARTESLRIIDVRAQGWDLLSEFGLRI